MAKKRSYGDGSISQLPDGRWWARITVGKNEQGKQQRKAFYGSSRKEVKAKLDAYIKEEQQENLDADVLTVESWLTAWMQDYYKPSVRPSTYRANQDHARCHIIPELGAYPLKDLSVDAVQKMINDMAAKGLTGTVRKTLSLLRRCLEQALQNDLIRKNVAKETVLPTLEEKRGQALTRDEQLKFIRMARHSYLGKIFILILATGLRSGEALALQWRDIDFDRATLRVQRTQVKYGPDGQSALSTNAPKTKDSARVIPLLPQIVTMLRGVQEEQNDLQEALGLEFSDGYVFCRETGEMIGHSSADYAVREILKKSGINRSYSMHSLRHSFATRCLENGVPIKVVQEFLGHSSIEMTCDLYMHVFDEIKQESILLMGDTFKPPERQEAGDAGAAPGAETESQREGA